MNAIKITAAFAQLLETASWVIINQDYAVGAYKSRQAARDAKASEGLEGSIKNKSEVEFEVINSVEPVAPEAEAEKPAKATASPVLHKSEVDHPCKRVWGIACDMKKANPDVKRGEVLAECVRQGVAYYTARTQYQQWLTIQKEEAARVASQAKG